MDEDAQADVAAVSGMDCGLEPLLGPQQRGLVGCVSHRIAAGVPYAATDLQVLSWLARTLGLSTDGLGS